MAKPEALFEGCCKNRLTTQDTAQVTGSEAVGGGPAADMGVTDTRLCPPLDGDGYHNQSCSLGRFESETRRAQ